MEAYFSLLLPATPLKPEKFWGISKNGEEVLVKEIG